MSYGISSVTTSGNTYLSSLPHGICGFDGASVFNYPKIDSNGSQYCSIVNFPSTQDTHNYIWNTTTLAWEAATGSLASGSSVTVNNFPTTQGVNLSQIGGTSVSSLLYDSSNTALKVNVVAGATGGGVAQTQVRNASNVWTDVGYYAGNSSMPVSVQNSSLAVTGTFWQTTQPVSGTFWQTTQPVSWSGQSVTANAGTNLNTSALALDATLTGGNQVAIAKGGAKGTTAAAVLTSNPIDANTQALHVDGSKVTQPVSGTFWQTTQPVSWTGQTVAATESGTWTVQPGNTANTTAWLVTGTGGTFPATQSGTWNIGTLTSITNAVTVSQATAANLNATTTFVAGSSVSLGTSTSKTVIGKPGSLATTATTADQVVLTYTVTTGKTFYLQWVDFNVRLTTYAATATLFGTISLESPSGTKLITETCAGSGALTAPIIIEPSEPIPIASGVVVRVVCTPAATTGFTWTANFGGYEK